MVQFIMSTWDYGKFSLLSHFFTEQASGREAIISVFCFQQANACKQAIISVAYILLHCLKQ